MTVPLTGIERIRLDALAVQLDERRSHTKATDLRKALELLDTYAGIVARVNDGWAPVVDWPDCDGGWERGRTTQPMTEMERALIYGEAP